MVLYDPSSPFFYSHKQFIHHHKEGKVFTQQAFNILKQVFWVLGVETQGQLELTPKIVYACFILKNILIRRNELDVEIKLKNIGAISHTEDAEDCASEPGDASSLEIRNHLSKYLVLAN